MTTLENARKYISITDLDTTIVKGHDWVMTEDILQDHSKHVLSQVITFLEANDRKTVKGVIEELKGKV